MTYFVVTGKLPPPIGGVRIHTMRLKSHLDGLGWDYRFIELSLTNLVKHFGVFWHAEFVHLHTSNVWLRFFLSLLFRVTRRKLIVTYHGNLGRFGALLNLVEFQSLKLSWLPIVLNEKSLEIARNINERAILISAFLPPSSAELEEALPESVRSAIENFRFEKVFCTNAYAANFDKSGAEIYGICTLIEIFGRHPNLGLIVSDPSGSYRGFLAAKKIVPGANILIISELHSFVKVLMHCDCMIRATSTDGDALSVKEALLLKRSVIASDCVSRPQGCLLYPTGNKASLEHLIDRFVRSHSNSDPGSLSGLESLLELYKNILSNSTQA